MKNKIIAGIIAAITGAIGTVTAFAEDATDTAAEVAEATAEATETTATWQSYIGIVVYLVLIIALFYFLIIRPNKKRKKEEEEMKSSLILGQEIVTIGGITGKIVNIKDDVITIQTSIDNTLIDFKNWAIREVVKPETDGSAN